VALPRAAAVLIAIYASEPDMQATISIIAIWKDARFTRPYSDQLRF